MHLEYPPWDIGVAVPLDSTGHLLREATLPRHRVKQFYLIHRNKHREAAKMRRQRNMAQMKGEIKIPEKELNKMEISNLSDAEFKTLVIRMLKKLIRYSNSIKKDPGRNEGYTKCNKEKFAGNQQWSGGN